MEEHKERCLNKIIGGERKKGKRREDKCDKCLQDMNIEQVRKLYSGSQFKFTNEGFKNMLLRDGWFVVQLLCRGTQDFDPILKKKWILTGLLHDLLLLENQLPFSVLVDLSQMTEYAANDGKSFASQACLVLSKLLPGPKNWSTGNSPVITDPSKIKHLLSLVHDNWSPSREGIERHKKYNEEKEKKLEEKGQGDPESGMITKGGRNSSKYWKSIFCASARDKENVRRSLQDWRSIRCATELEEAGIRFVNAEVDSDGNSTDGDVIKSLFDVSFDGSTMKIPTFWVEGNTERLFRNLIAHELYNEGSTYVMDYVRLMDNLINSAKDVKLLRLSGVIGSMIGDDEALAQMINKLREYVTPVGDNFYYEEIFDGLNKHCARKWNTYKAKLRHDYFHSPWAHVSFLAALAYILLTIGQFVSAVIPLFKKEKQCVEYLH